MDQQESVNHQVIDAEEKSFEKRARQRVHFRIHFCIYLLVVALLWLLWFFLFKNASTGEGSIFLKLSWAVTLIWGLVVLAHYLFAIRWNKSMVEKEVAKLKKREAELKKQETKLKEQLAQLNTRLDKQQEEINHKNQSNE